MKNILLAAVLGALVAFIWGFISWVVLPYHNMALHKMKNEDQMIEMMKQNLVKTRVYAFPWHDEMAADKKADEQAVAEKFSRGPIGYVFYQANGRDMSDPKQFIFGFLISFVASALIAFTLTLAADRLPKYLHRVFFVTCIALFAALVSHLYDWNWLWYPTRYSLLNTADLAFTWFLVGLVLAWRIKPVKNT